MENIKVMCSLFADPLNFNLSVEEIRYSSIKATRNNRSIFGQKKNETFSGKRVEFEVLNIDWNSDEFSQYANIIEDGLNRELIMVRHKLGSKKLSFLSNEELRYYEEKNRKKISLSHIRPKTGTSKLPKILLEWRKF